MTALDLRSSANAPSEAGDRQAFYDRIGKKSFAPLWEVLTGIAPREPVTTLKPHLWAWDETRPYLMEAGALLTADEAERRALLLENPSLPGKSRTTETLTGAVQLVLPNEVAPAHRHTQLAVRFVLESDGGFTTVDGERTPMRPGDFIITPSWAFHDHGNNGSDPLLFLDVVDSPISRFFGTGFSDLHDDKQQMIIRQEGELWPGSARDCCRLMPQDHMASRRRFSTIRTSAPARPSIRRRAARPGSPLGPHAPLLQSAQRRVGDAVDRELDDLPAVGFCHSAHAIDQTP